jgi:hypothetical protein
MKRFIILILILVSFFGCSNDILVEDPPIGEIIMSNLATDATTSYTYSGGTPNIGVLAYINDGSTDFTNSSHGYDAYNAEGVTPTVDIVWTLKLLKPGYVTSVSTYNYCAAGTITIDYKDLFEIWHTIGIVSGQVLYNSPALVSNVNNNVDSIRITFHLTPHSLGGGEYNTSGRLIEAIITGDLAEDSKVRISDGTNTYLIFTNPSGSSKLSMNNSSAIGLLFGTISNSFALPLRVHDGLNTNSFLGKLA